MSIKLVVVSDSHGLIAPLSYIKSKHSDADYFIHCGDICLSKSNASGFEVICGNCDDPAQYPCNGKILELAGHRIMVIHGHVLFDSETDVDTAIKKVAESAKRNHCDIAFFGHLHIYCDVFVDGIRVCSPGSIWHNRDGSTPSYMSVQISECVVNITKETYAPY